MTTVTASTPVAQDFYELYDLLPDVDRALLGQVRAFMEESVAPIINRYWTRAEFPFELVAPWAELGLGGLPYEGYGCPGASYLLEGLAALEMARVDCSFATFHGAHSGLAMGSIYLAGSEEQKEHWLPRMARFEKIGAFDSPSLMWARARPGADDHRPPRWRRLGAGRSEEVDRQPVRRRHRDLGS